MRFANPEFLVLFLIFLYPLLKSKEKRAAFVRFPHGDILGNKKSIKVFLSKFLDLLKYAALILIIIALARPQEGRNFDESDIEGIDIIIAIDVSSSMRSLDFYPYSRLETAKTVASDFIKQRKYDRIGLVIFAGMAFTQCPLTTDKESLLSFVGGINIGDTGIDGTAIGSAVVTSSLRLKDSKAKNKILILITDGNSNMGEVDPVTAAKIASKYGIKIYPVGVGSPDGALIEVDDPFFGKRQVRVQEEKLNEYVLKDIAEITGGQYFRATDTASFKNIMDTIDKMEKEKIKVQKFTSYNELYKKFALWAFVFLLLAVLLENTYLRRLP